MILTAYGALLRGLHTITIHKLFFVDNEKNNLVEKSHDRHQEHKSSDKNKTSKKAKHTSKSDHRHDKHDREPKQHKETDGKNSIKDKEKHKESGKHKEINSNRIQTEMCKRTKTEKNHHKNDGHATRNKQSTSHSSHNSSNKSHLHVSTNSDRHELSHKHKSSYRESSHHRKSEKEQDSKMETNKEHSREHAEKHAHKTHEKRRTDKHDHPSNFHHKEHSTTLHTVCDKEKIKNDTQTSYVEGRNDDDILTSSQNYDQSDYPAWTDMKIEHADINRYGEASTQLEGLFDESQPSKEVNRTDDMMNQLRDAVMSVKGKTLFITYSYYYYITTTPI